MNPRAEEHPGDEAWHAAKERVGLPAMFLTAVAALNLLVGLAQVGLVVYTAVTPPERVKQMWEARLRAAAKAEGGAGFAHEALAKMRDIEPERFVRQRLATDIAAAAVVLTVGVLGFTGGVRMYQARTYPLALTGALATLLPCVSPMSFCCAGELIGGWCVVALLLPGVRAAFR